jgi:hypothetical protein
MTTTSLSTENGGGFSQRLDTDSNGSLALTSGGGKQTDKWKARTGLGKNLLKVWGHSENDNDNDGAEPNHVQGKQNQ